MKKFVVAVLSVLCFTPAVFADNWGVGVKLGVGENNPKSLSETYDEATSYDRTLTKSPVFAGVEGLYEWDLTEADKLGLRLGIDVYGQNKLELKSFGDVTESTVAIPVTAYYKEDQGIREWSLLLGAGFTYISTEVKGNGLFDFTETEDKIFPHIVAGAEYRFTRLFALGFEAKYNFGAKIKKDGEVLSDRSGVSGAVTGRFYF